MQVPAKTQQGASAVVFYAENISGGKSVTQHIDIKSTTLDFALAESFETEGKTLKAGTWNLCQHTVHEREILNSGKNKGDFFSIELHENTYLAFFEKGYQKTGWFTKPMAYPILKLITLINSNNENGDKNTWIQIYTHLIMVELRSDSFKISTNNFDEMKKIYRSVKRLHTLSSNFPTPSELMQQSGVKPSRFQKGCLTLYGQPLQNIIRYLKMKQGFEEILENHKSIASTAYSLGYEHPDNFITAFHRHFSVTPMQVRKFYRS